MADLGAAEKPLDQGYRLGRGQSRRLVDEQDAVEGVHSGSSSSWPRVSASSLSIRSARSNDSSNSKWSTGT